MKISPFLLPLTTNGEVEYDSDTLFTCTLKSKWRVNGKWTKVQDAPFPTWEKDDFKLFTIDTGSSYKSPRNLFS